MKRFHIKGFPEAAAVHRQGLMFTLLAMLAFLVPAAAGWTRSHPFMLYTPADVSGLQTKYSSDPFYGDPAFNIRIDCRSRYLGSSTSSSVPDRRYWQAVRSHAGLLMLDPVAAADPKYNCNARFNDYYFTLLNYSGWSDIFGDDQVDGPYYLAGLILGFDMYYNNFTSSQRSDIVNKLATRADYIVDHSNVADSWLFVPPDLNDAGGYLKTFKVLRNKYIIGLSALGLIAYGLDGSVDETRRQRWLSTVDAALAAWASKTMKDGVSLESYSYQEFMMQLFAIFLEVRSRVTGQNQFLLYPSVTQHPVYSIYAAIPGGDRSFIQCMPFGDCDVSPAGSVRLTASIMAHRLKGTAYDAYARLENWVQYKPYNGTANYSYDFDDSAHFFYGDSSVPMKSPTDLALPPFHYFPASGTFVWRSGWDNMATYFAMACQPMLGGHEAPEAGNFVIYKGGAPFIASQGYLLTHRTVDHNVMMIEGKGQLGESLTDGVSKPQQSVNWPSVTQALADDQFFDVTVNLKPCYASTQIASYTREFAGFADFYFVRDRTSCSASVQHDNVLHAFKTTQPTVLNDTLDLNSNPTGQPWIASGTSGYTLKPRDSGPFSAAMSVINLSAKSWSSAVAADKVNISSSGSTSQRGYKLTFTQSGSAVTSLMGFYLPGSGQTLAKWPGADGEGFVVSTSGVVSALGVWTDTGTINGTQGITLNGAAGGLHLAKSYFWGRAATVLSYNGTSYLTATTPVSVFSCTLNPRVGRIRLLAPAASTVKLRCAMPVKEVWKDGVKLAAGTQWSQGGGMLTLNVGATGTTQATFSLVTAAAADPGWLRQE